MSNSPFSALDPQVAYLGPIGSFSHQAAQEFFGTAADLRPHDSFDSVLNAVQSQESTAADQTSQYAVVPIENSSNGTVVSLLDLLADREKCYSDLKVCAEYYLSVHHCLLVSPAEDHLPDGSEDKEGSNEYSISKLYTHPQVWGQCTRFLTERLKGTARIDTASTSAAAQQVAQNPLHGTNHQVLSNQRNQASRIAAIASPLAAQIHNLHILASNIEDEANNTTRFLVLYNHNLISPTSITQISPLARPLDNPASQKRKTLLSFTLDHSTPGSLSDALSVFRTHGFNLTSIETRPSRLRPWHYIFFVECEEEVQSGTRGQEIGDGLKKMLVELKGRTERCRDFGSWEDAWVE